MGEAGRVIYAKSWQQGRRVTLAEHARDVLDAFTHLFGTAEARTRLAECWLRFFGLDEGDAAAFLTNGWIACALHDVGKANDQFQAAVLTPGKGRQAIRHEHLSALLLWEPTVRAWLREHAADGVDAEIVVGAVLSHHLKANDKNLAAWAVAQDTKALRVYGDAPDVAAVLGMAAVVLSVPAPRLAVGDAAWGYIDEIVPKREQLKDDLYAFKRALARDTKRKRLLVAVKTAVIAADSAGSAATREGLELGGWLAQAFGGEPLTAEEIERGVIRPRVREMERRGRWSGFHDFQVQAATLGPRALLLAGCGSGKTLAAWKWIAAQLEARPASRVMFLYPTRATAKEGFRDYVSWTGAEIGTLVSGTARYDLEGLFANPGEGQDGDYTTPERLFALGYWGKRVFSATVDSFLAMMANRYAALCMAPLLADSVIVVDEVHSFDKEMFKALERFLTFFDVPVLCMTASLPSRELAVLRDTCHLERYPREDDRFEDLERQGRTGRYVVRVIEPADAEDVARAAVAAGKRVLWVVNTVARCQAAAQSAAGWAGAGTVLCYHSRFKLKHRTIRHDEVIRRFGGDERPLLLVTTQVCEMSLDLDADVLISEGAPIPPLIQRMGRCCREPEPKDGRIGEVYVYEPDGALPYEVDDVAQGLAFAWALTAEARVSQELLAERLAEAEVKHPYAEGGFAGLLDSGGYAMGRDDRFREDDDYTVDAVLACDRDEWLKQRKARAPEADGLVLPAPRRQTREDAELGAFVRVVTAGDYTREFGLEAPG